MSHYLAGRIAKGAPLSIDKIAFNDPDGSGLTFECEWAFRGTMQSWEGDTFTPTKEGRYIAITRATDGEGDQITKHKYFTVYPKMPVDRTEFTIDENVTFDQALATVNFRGTGAHLPSVHLFWFDGCRLEPWESTPFKIREGRELWQRNGTTFDHELKPTIKIVVSNFNQFGGQQLGNMVFTLTVRDVAEAPEIQLPDGPVFYLTQDDLSSTRSFSLFDSDLVFTRTSVSSKVRSRLDDDRFELKQQFPHYISDSFGDLPTRQFYKIVAKEGQSFTAGETVSLTITALDNEDQALNVTKTLTIHIVTADGSWEIRNQMRGTPNRDDVFVVDTEAGSRSYADIITGFEDVRDRVKIHANDLDVAKNANRVSWEGVVDTDDPTKKDIIIYAGGAKDADKILAVIEDFDAAGIFDVDDFVPLAGVTFAQI